MPPPPPSRGRNGSPHPRSRKFAAYHRSMRLSKPAVSKPTISSPESQGSLRRKSRNTTARKEVKIGSMSPRPSSRRAPGHFLGAMGFSRTSPRHIDTNMSVPSAPPPSPTPALAAQDDLEWEDELYVEPELEFQFLEDPRWRRTLSFNGSRSTALNCVECAPEKLNCLSVHPPVPQIPSSPSRAPMATRTMHPQHEEYGNKVEDKSKDAESLAVRRSSCNPVQFQDLAIGRSAIRLRERVAEKGWLSKAIRELLELFRPKELTPMENLGRVGVPKQALLGREIYSQQSMDIVAPVARGKEDNAMFRSVNDEAGIGIKDPELADILHNPANVSRFSDGWAEYLVSHVGDDRERLESSEHMSHDFASSYPATAFERRELRAGDINAFQGFPAYQSDVVFNAAGPQPFGDFNYDISLSRMQQSHNRNPQYTKDGPPVFRFTQAEKDDRTVVAPDPGPRIPKRGVKLENVIRLGNDLKSFGRVSLPISSNISERRVHRSGMASEAQWKTLDGAFEDAFKPDLNLARSTDTLTRIEAQLPPSRPPTADMTEVPTRFSQTLPPRVGPSGSPPERALPKLPDNHDVLLGDGTSLKIKASSHSRRHPRSARSTQGRGRGNHSSSSSVTTIRAISPIRAQQSTSSSPEKSGDYRAQRLNSLDSKTSDLNRDGPFLNQLTLGTNADVRSPTSIYSQDSILSSAASGYAKKQANKAVRADRVKALKRRDLTSHAIEEEDESDGTNLASQILDLLDHFPDVPTSRPASRTNSVQYQGHSVALRSQKPCNGSLQMLGQSGIMVWADACPNIPESKTPDTGPDKIQSLAESPLRTLSVLSPKQRPRGKPPHKKNSQRSIHSHISASAVATSALNGTRTPPSSSDSSFVGVPCNENRFISLDNVEGRRLEMQVLNISKQIEKISADMTKHGRTIEKMQRMFGLFRPGYNNDGSRSRSRDGDLCDVSRDRQRMSSSSSLTQCRTGPGSVTVGRRPVSSMSSATIASVDKASNTGPGPGPGPARLEAGVEDDTAHQVDAGDDEKRLSATLSTSKFDGMLEHMASSPGFGYATVFQSPVKIQRIERAGEKTEQGRRTMQASRMLWLQTEQEKSSSL